MGILGFSLGGKSAGRKANGNKNMDPVRPADVAPRKGIPIPAHVEGHAMTGRKKKK